MREQKLNRVPLVWYEGDDLPIIKDQLFQDTAQTNYLNLSGASASIWMFDYYSAIDFNSPVVSGVATITSATSGALEYQFTTTQTNTLAGEATSMYRGFWKIDWATDTLHFRIPTLMRFIKIT